MGMQSPMVFFVAAATSTSPTTRLATATCLALRFHVPCAPWSRKRWSINLTMAEGGMSKSPGRSGTGTTKPLLASDVRIREPYSCSKAVFPAPGMPCTTTVCPASPRRTPRTAMSSSPISSSRPAKTFGGVLSLISAMWANESRRGRLKSVDGAKRFS